MIISLIAALTVNRVIGIKNCVPWSLPIDMKWFKYHTLNKPIIMGRKTFESIGKKPLQNRLNIVLSRFLSNNYSDVHVVKNINQALSLVKYSCEEIMIIGGEEVYNAFLPRSRRLYLTYIDIGFHIYGDAWFPYYDVSEWKYMFTRFYRVNNKNGHFNVNFNILERV